MDFKKYLTLDSANLSAYNNLGVAYYKKGEFSLAIQQFNYLIKKDGTNGQYYYFRSLNYAGKEDYNNAYSDLLKAKQAGFSVDENLLKQWQSKAAEKTIQEPSN
jgi:tetratricopeptide (TPR) repeat protein